MADVAARYEGRPFLKLLECFVLWSIGELPESQVEALDEMTPSLQATYGSSGDWRQIVAEQMDFPDTLPEALRGMWDRSVEAARSAHESVDPAEFARQVADRNFM